MKKLFNIASVVVILALLVPPIPAQAQAFTPFDYSGCRTSGKTVSQCNAEQLAYNQAAAEAYKQTPEYKAQNPGDIGCNLSAAGIAICLTNVIYVVTVGIGSAFAYVAAIFFDFAVALSLNSFSYAINFINSGWTVARDIANMFFILILIYIAFTIMLNADTTGTMKTLALVIFIALIVNFSFLITRVVIDAGNILAVQFYNAIDAPLLSSTANQQTTASNAPAQFGNYITGYGSNTKDLAAPIMGALQLTNLFNEQSFKQFAGNQSGISGFGVTFIALTFLYIAAAIILWLLTIAFVVNAIKFLVRIVVLWFCIIASPLAFVARTIPAFKTYYDQWQDALIKHSFYPVIFLFIFLVLVVFMKGMSASCGVVGSSAPIGNNCLIGSAFSQIGNANSGFIAAIGVTIANIGIRLGLVIAMLYLGMKVADSIGVIGANAARSAGNRVSGWYKGAFRYGPGWATGALYRQTGGRAANWADKQLAGSTWANTKGTFGGALGYRLRRNVLAPMKETSLGTVASSFKGREEFLKKREGEMAANTADIENRKTMDNLMDFDAKHSALDTQYKDLQDLRALELKPIMSLTPDERDKTLELRKKVPDSVSARKEIEELKAKKDLMTDRIKTFGKRELTELKGAEIEKILKYLSDSQLKTIKDIDRFSDNEKRGWEIKWNKESPDSAISKANKQISVLRDIDKKLGGVPGLADAIRKEGTITAASVTRVKEHLDAANKQADEEFEDARTLPSGDPTRKVKIAQAQAKRRLIADAKKAAGDLDDRRKEVRAGIDRENGNAQEFTAK